jgi:hypothetical protein
LQDFLSFKASWKRWWARLQPPERRVSDAEPLAKEGVDDVEWKELRKGSINGFYTIIVSLSWWLRFALDDPIEGGDFVEVLSDVSWVQDRMIESLERNAKRAREEEESPAGASPAKRYVKLLLDLHQY